MTADTARRPATRPSARPGPSGVWFALHVAAIVAVAVAVCVGAYGLANASDPERARRLRAALAAEPACSVFQAVPIAAGRGAAMNTVGPADPALMAAVAALIPPDAQTRPSRRPIYLLSSYQLVFAPGSAANAWGPNNVVAWVGPDWFAVTRGGETWEVSNVDQRALAAVRARLEAMPRTGLPTPGVPAPPAAPPPAPSAPE